MNPLKIERPKLLIVEGKDEANFFTAAPIKHLNITDVQVMPIGGKSKLTANMKALKNDLAFSTVQCLAVVRDADTTELDSAVTAATAAFQSIRGSLTHEDVHMAVPPGHAQFADGQPRIGTFILPDGVSDGMLETVCMTAVSSRPEYQCVTSFFDCCQAHNIMPNNIHKARAYAWLASQPNPDLRVGEAAQAGYWPLGAPAFQNLWNFLQAI